MDAGTGDDSDTVAKEPGATEPGETEIATETGTIALERQDDRVVVRVTGALDLALAPRLQQFVDRAARLHPALLVLDLTEVDFLASAGMAVLVKANRNQVAPTQMRVVAADRVVLRPLQMTRLTDELAVYPTLAEAFAG
ncbi:STAS domain-containing protein [Labedaea rhizosphaerae]|nr:STAS domain-containing protein [Labedaea rhizosphaerae]